MISTIIDKNYVLNQQVSGARISTVLGVGELHDEEPYENTISYGTNCDAKNMMHGFLIRYIFVLVKKLCRSIFRMSSKAINFAVEI